MNYYIENQTLDKTLSEIRIRLRTSMNGVVADSMREKGIVYKRNFGVDIARLKEIAAKYTPNHDLAQRLWASGTREMMIMATLLATVGSFTEDVAERWLQSVNNVELTEHVCMNLFSKLPYAKQLSFRLIESENDWRQITGFTLAGRLWKEFSDKEANEMVAIAVEKSESDSYNLNRAITLALSRLCRRGKEMSEKIRTHVSKFEHSDKLTQRYIADEIANEITFLEF